MQGFEGVWVWGKGFMRLRTSRVLGSAIGVSILGLGSALLSWTL